MNWTYIFVKLRTPCKGEAEGVDGMGWDGGAIAIGSGVGKGDGGGNYDRVRVVIMHGPRIELGPTYILCR